jgi:hypothetical protein
MTAGCYTQANILRLPFSDLGTCLPTHPSSTAQLRTCEQAARHRLTCLRDGLLLQLPDYPQAASTRGWETLTIIQHASQHSIAQVKLT